MAAGWRTLNTDGDLPRHLLMGRVILQTHSIPHEELFSYVYAGRAYVAHEWLADVIYYASYSLLGLKGVVLLTAILIATTFFVLYRALAADYQERLVILVLVLWGAANTFQHWIARPHLFSMFFLALWLVGVDRISRGKFGKFWVLPLLMVLWANIHAEFVAGFLVLLAYIAGWFWDWLFRRQEADWKVLKVLALTLLLCAGASLLNPFGVEAWRTILSYLGNNQLMSTISETRPPDFTNPSFLVEFTLIIASIVLLGLKGRRLPGGQAFLLAGFTALALMAGRNIHLYGVVAPFVLAAPAVEVTDCALLRRVGAAMTGIESQLKGFLWPVATVLVFLALVLTGRIGNDYVLDPKLFPVQAVQWLDANPQPGHMFNDFAWGGYLVWNLWPAQKDFIDSQSDLTGEATRQYGTVENLSNGWQAVLDEYDVKWVIMPPDSGLIRALIQDGWKVLYRDTTAIIVRRE